MVKILDKLFGSRTREKSEAEDYTELDLSVFEDSLKDESANMYIRIAELEGLDLLPELKKQVYDGNALIIDVSLTRNDKLIFDRTIKDLKQVVNDVHGDIALINESQVIVTPCGVRIDRQKLK